MHEEREEHKHEEQEAVPVQVKDLRKSFGSQKVLDGIDFEVHRADTVAVLGRSGTGKSVLLKLLIGLHTPDAGSIRMYGREITGLPREQLNEIRKKIGFLFQHGALYDSLTIEQNVDFPLSRHTKMAATERRDLVHDLLSQVGMEEDAKKMPSEISGGMQKRAGLARALALNPDLLLFDEPTSGLDPITASEIINLILRLKEERHVTSIVVTHDIHAAKSFADRLLVIDEGHVVTDGTYADLERSRNQFVSRFLKEAA